MNEFEYKNHWEEVFETKDTTKVSWFQASPTKDIERIKKYASERDLIIDIGGGDSSLPKALLNEGYENITLLDISSKAIESNKSKMGLLAESVNWINSDVRNWQIDKKYNLWFDRAVFHFITDKSDQTKYVLKAKESLLTGGILILGTFSKNDGPTKCSGISVNQHDKKSIEELFKTDFKLLESYEELHITPSGSTQNFHWNILQKI